MLNYLAAQTSEEGVAGRLLGCLNALFPSFLPLDSEEDIDPDPCSCGLQESIRLTVFNTILEDGWAISSQQQVLRMRLLDWCGVPQYSEARLALLRYAEITRKLEEVLVEVFAACDEDEDTLDSPTEDLFNSMIDLRDRKSVCRERV